MKSVTIRFLLPVAVGTILLSAAVVYWSFRADLEHLHDGLDDQAELALEFDLAIRDYVGSVVRPALSQFVPPAEFVPELMSSSYVARQVFERVRERFPNIIIKFASEDPRNPANRASPTEARMIRYFAEHPEEDRWAGVVVENGVHYQAHYRARRMVDKCLQCHGRPEDAPAALLARYGDQAGFHRRVGDVIALDVVALPHHWTTGMMLRRLAADWALPIGAVAITFGLTVWIFRRVVGRRLARMRVHFEHAAAGLETAALGPVDVGGHDEIRALAESFNTLARRLRESRESLEHRVAERTLELAQRSADLQREVVERRQVEETLRDSNNNLVHINRRLATAGEEIKSLMRRAAAEHTVAARFHNPSLQRCWEVKNCGHSACPAYGRVDQQRCWEVAGTFCGGAVQGVDAKKLEDHRSCAVYQHAHGDPINDLGETFNEMIGILEERQEALQRARATAEAGTRAKSEFLANMSHEIRTPMTAILGFTTIIQEEIACCPVCPAHQDCEERATGVELVGIVRRNAEHLLSIVNDILDLSKIEAGRMVAERIRIPLSEVIAPVVSLMEARAKGKNLALCVEYESAIPETIETDPTRLRQVLTNLIGNALKFTETGSVRLIARLVRSGENSSALELDVLDTGIGLASEQTAEIFEPFSQADASVTRKFGGTGLGLSISRRLAQLLGGNVQLIETQPGRGTRFRATIDPGPLHGIRMLADPAAATVALQRVEPPPQDRSRTLAGARILLVEDGPDNLRLITHFLRNAGAEVTTAENGQVALQIAREIESAGQSLDVILMDIQMPVMDGLEATRRLRQSGYTGPIIALTAHAMVSDRALCSEAGCDDHVAKPIDRQILVEAVNHHLNRGKATRNDASVASDALLSVQPAGQQTGGLSPVAGQSERGAVL